VEIVEITFTGEKWGKIIDHAVVKTSVGITLNGVKIIEGGQGLFVAMPSRKVDTGFQDTVIFSDESVAEMFKTKVLEAYTGSEKTTEAESNPDQDWNWNKG